MERVNPTRMSLLLKREEIKDASAGAELLRSKRDVLLREFLSALKPLLALRESLDRESSRATESLVFALGSEGKEKLSLASFVTPAPLNFHIDYKNLLGLKIPEVIFESRETGTEGIEAGVAIKETQDNFRNFLRIALTILPAELKLKRLGREIKSTTRKVNSLEKYVIPELRSQVKFIRETLEEREREDIFRLKRIKKKRGGGICLD